MAYTYVLQIPFDTGDNTLVKRPRDTLVIGDNDGVRFLFDLDFPWSYPGGPVEARQPAGAPADGAALYDMVERANGAARIAQPGAITFAGRGFDFSAVTTRSNFIEIPGSVATDLWNPVNGKSQLYLMMLYLRMPTLANWAEVNQFFNSAPLLSWCAKTNVNWGSADVDLVSLTAFNNGMYAKRMTAGYVASPTTNAVYVDIAATLAQCQVHQGRFTQVGIYRTESAYGLRFRSSAGTTLLEIGASGTASTTSFAGAIGRLGISNIMGWPATITNAHDFRIYRAAIENLARSGRDPKAVLDADYTRTTTRAVFA